MHLVLPGLAADFGGYARASFPPAPALSHWLARARVRDVAATGPDTAACQLCGVAPALAALAWLGDFGEPPHGYCLRLDPVHLRADTRGLVLFDALDAGLEEAEATALADSLRAEFERRGLRLRLAAPGRWYLETDDPATWPDLGNPAQQSGRPVRPPRAGTAGAWAGCLNEWQMILHDHPVNRARAEQRRPAINGLWPWGGGRLPEPGQAPARLQGSPVRPVWQGLARLHGSEYAVLPHALPDAAACLSARATTLTCIETLEASARTGDPLAWSEALEALDRQLLPPLMKARARVELLPLNGRAYLLHPLHRFAFWRRPRDYRDRLLTLA
ncbi:MAG TPA: hypothetical protein ENJ79_00615 [Gammaproteobacteria bacterium]|nr:hypothetical protein [Gammaproteobacteria bacterium]